MESAAELACLHCWHSDPDTSGESRWFCCRDNCGARCIQNYLDVRKCRHCNIRMLVDSWGFCGICGQFISSWIFERTLADTLKEDCAQVVEEYLTVKGLPPISQLRSLFHVSNENRHVSAHGHHRLGRSRSNRKIRKIQRQKAAAGIKGNHPSRKPIDRFSRARLNDLPYFSPQEQFWALFHQINTGEDHK
jgi:hypothetical protein